MSSNDVMTVKEVAEQFKVQQRTVRVWIANGRLPAFKGPGGRNLLIRRDDVLPLLGETQDAPATTEQASAAPQVGAPFKATDSRVVRPSQATTR